jgi:Protein of unknown function (DUF3108)
MVLIKMFKAVSTLVIVLSLVLPVARAQSIPEKVASAPRITQPLPFKVGETLTYEVNFSKLIFSGTIGELKLMVSKPANSSGTDMLELSADAVSKGFFPSLFGVKVKDRYVSLVNQTDFGVYSSTKLLDEGKVRREQKSVIDREAGRVTYTDRDLTKTASPPRVKEKPSPSWVQDLLSSIYFVRVQPLKDGDVIPLPISDAGEVYNVEIVVLKRDDIKTDAGKFHAIQLSAKVFDGRYIRRKGEMLVWVSDDAARIPLHVRVRTSGTTVTVDLKRAQEGG